MQRGRLVREGELAGMVRLALRLRGGKGGYGKQMRCRAVKNFKPTNVNHSRDLQGRRIIYVEMEQQIIAFEKKKAFEDPIVAQDLQEFKSVEQNMRQERAVEKIESVYAEVITDVEQDITSSVLSGFAYKRERANSQKAKMAGLVSQPSKKFHKEVTAEDLLNSLFE